MAVPSQSLGRDLWQVGGGLSVHSPCPACALRDLPVCGLSTAPAQRGASRFGDPSQNVFARWANNGNVSL